MHKNKNRRYRMSDEDARKLGLEVNRSGRYRLAPAMEKQYLLLRGKGRQSDDLRLTRKKEASGVFSDGLVEWESEEWKVEQGGSTNIEELAKEFDIDLSIYEPKSIKTAHGPGQKWVSAEWKRKPEVSEDRLQNILEKIKSHAPKYYLSTPVVSNDDNVLLMPILYDAHIEKMIIEGKEANYVAIARQIIDKTLSMGYTIGRIVFVLGNDFGNADNVQGTTTKGTPQDNKVHWARGIDIRCQIAIDTIEIFSSLAPTDVIMVHGNHDRYSNQWLGKYVQAWFRNNDRVTVNNDGTAPRKYYSWKKNMWGFVHGNEERDVLLPSLMATEVPHMYARAEYREVFKGHFHSKKSAYYPLSSQNGILIRWMPALSGIDDWHKLKGFASQRAGMGIIYNKHGYDSEFAINID